VAKACLETGTEEAWCELVRRTQPDLSGAVRRTCLKYGLDPYEYSEDLVQGVYLKLVEKPFKLLKTLASLDDKGIKLYLRAVATNRTTDLYRSLTAKGGNLFVTDSFESLTQELPDPKTTDVDMRLLLQKVDQVVSESLSGPNAARDRAVFWLYFREGLSARQIAAIPGIGLSESDVEVLLRRLIRILRKKLR
jgi:RNA polymerase sigma-70 factor (ECF subfamily)